MLTEKKFEDYADIAASKFYAEEVVRKEEFEARRKADRESRDANGGGQGFNRDGGNRRDDRGGPKGGRDNRDGRDNRGKRGYNDDKSGINFSKGPPKFTSTKSVNMTPGEDPNAVANPETGAAGTDATAEVTYNKDKFQSMAAPARGER